MKVILTGLVIGLFVFGTAGMVEAIGLSDPLSYPPTAVAGNYFADESSAVGGAWKVELDASNSTDDYGIVLYEWDWDNDGTYDFSDTVSTASHDWSSGTYKIILKVTDGENQVDSAQGLVTLNPGAPPVANAGSDIFLDGSAASGSVWTVGFDASSSIDDFGIWKYEWDWDNDGTFDESSIDPTASHSWSARGDYSIGLMVTDHVGQTDYDFVQVSLSGSPAAVPEPSTILLLGCGLAGLAFYHRKRRKV